MDRGRQVYMSLRQLIDSIAVLGSGQAAVLSNEKFAQNALQIGAAAPQLFDLTVPFVTQLGNVQIWASMSVTGTGGTSTAGEAVQFALRAGGALIATSPLFNTELSATHNVAAGSLSMQLVGIGAGLSQTYGVECTNVTTGGHTLVVPALGAWVQVRDTLK